MPYRYRGPNNAPQDFVVSFERTVDASALNAVKGADRLVVEETDDGAVVVNDVGGSVKINVTVQAGDEISDADWALWDMANQPCKRYWRRV